MTQDQLAKALLDQAMWFKRMGNTKAYLASLEAAAKVMGVITPSSPARPAR